MKKEEEKEKKVHHKSNISKEEETKILKKFLKKNKDLVYSWMKVESMQCTKGNNDQIS